MEEVILNLKNELIGNNSNSSRKLRFQIVQVGCGGNGGYLVQQLAQMFSLTQQEGFYLLADPDRVEQKNLRNQLFIPSDVDKSKAEVLSKRYRVAYQIAISYYDKKFIESLDSLKALFDIAPAPLTVYGGDVHFPILIGCVDNTYSRKLFHEYFMQESNLLYIDAGVDAAKIPVGKTLDDLSTWTVEEKKNFANTGFSGQIVAGLRLNGETILEPAGIVYPDILEDDDHTAPSEAACSSVVASDPQRLMTNRMAAMAMSVYFNDLFSNGIIRNHFTVFNSRKGYMRSQPITM